MSDFPILEERVTYQELNSHSVLVNLESGDCFQIDAVGTLICRLCDGKHSVEEIIKKVVSFYEVEEKQATEDILSFVEGMHSKGLIKKGDEEE